MTITDDTDAAVEMSTTVDFGPDIMCRLSALEAENGYLHALYRDLVAAVLDVDGRLDRVVGLSSGDALSAV